MFETIEILGTPAKSIRLATRENADIKNEVRPEPGAAEKKMFESICERHKTWKLRRGATGTYNCYGHVWANRRTAIFDRPEVDKIFRDDAYSCLMKDIEPQKGDIAIYKIGDRITHAGVVYGFRRGFGGRIPLVLSKINDFGGEVIHLLNDFPNCDFDHFLTDRFS